MFLSQLKWLNFLGQNDSKLSHFDLKSWVTGGIKIQPNFLGQSDSIFSLSAPRGKMSHFDSKTWVTGGTKI